MSLEKAAAILEEASAKQSTSPTMGLDPNSATVVDKKTDATKDLKVDLKTDSLKEPVKEPIKPVIKEEKKAVAEEPKEEKKDFNQEETKESKEKVSQRFAILAKKEKDIYRTTLKLKEQEASITEKAKAIENFENFRSQVRENPMMALKELGITYDDLTKYVLSGKMPTGSDQAVKEVREELAALRSQLDEKDKQLQERRKERAEQTLKETVDAFNQEIGDYLKSNADKYELINLNAANNLVYQAIEQHFESTQRLLSVAEASDMVERYLEEQVEKNLRAKKLASRIQPQSKPGETRQTQSAQQRTLNNEMTSSAPSLLPEKTEHDRISRALAALSR